MGVLAALYHRDGRGGTGQHVDVSMYEPVLHLLNGTIAGWDPEGPAPTRTGSRVPGGVPRNTYQCRDGGWVAISGTTDNQVARILATTHDDLPWFRVVRADGTIPKGTAQRDLLIQDGVPMRGDRVDLERARA